jgi:hypothetical protein
MRAVAPDLDSSFGAFATLAAILSADGYGALACRVRAFVLIDNVHDKSLSWIRIGPAGSLPRGLFRVHALRQTAKTVEIEGNFTESRDLRFYSRAISAGVSCERPPVH